MLATEPQLTYELVGSWKPAHSRYMRDVTNEALASVDFFYRNESVGEHTSVHTLISRAGRNGDCTGEVDEDNRALIHVYHDELVHRKIVVSELGSTIAHEICHLIRGRSQRPESIGDYLADEGIAYLIGALAGRCLGSGSEYDYICRIARSSGLRAEFDRVYGIAHKTRNPIDDLFDDLMYKKRFLGNTKGRKNRALPIGVAMGIRLALNRRAEGLGLVELIHMPTSDFFRGEL